MKIITILSAIFACACVFGQQQISMIGTNNPIVSGSLEINNGSPEDPCSEENPNDMTFENGFNTSSATDFRVANDLTVAAGEDFTLTNITASFFANGGIANVDVTYYLDGGGVPGAETGFEDSVVIDSQAVIGSNFGFDVNEVKMTVAPFDFPGQAGTPTTYWIELVVTDGGGTGSVFWVVTSSSMMGKPSAQFDGGWAIPDPVMDGVYIWEGECTTLGVDDNAQSGFSYFPNPTHDIVNLSSTKNIDFVSVYSLLGQKLLELAPNAINAKVDIQSLAKGTYIMQVNVNGDLDSFKIIRD